MNIEETKKILENLKTKKIGSKASFLGIATFELEENEKQAIENILADRERLEKENEKLKDIKKIKKELVELKALVSELLEQRNKPTNELPPHRFPH